MACSRPSIVLALLAVGSAVACRPKEDTSDNVFASASADSTSDASSDGSSTADASGTGSQTGFPATYRFECVDIQGIGDADGTAIQAQVLENTWGADIDNYKLNILLEVIDRDDAGGTASLGIRSGVGPDAANLCTEPSSESETIAVDYTQGQVLWEPVNVSGECSGPSTGTSGGTYDMMLTAEHVVYIYAEDDDTTTFNCTPDESPDAVPIRAVQAQVSTNEEETVVAGTLTGCLVSADAMRLCSCLVSCNNMGPGDLHTEGDCAGCPTGSTPLNQLLGGVNPSPRCTDLMGEDAFDLVIGFSARRLPNVPTTCG